MVENIIEELYIFQSLVQTNFIIYYVGARDWTRSPGLCAWQVLLTAEPSCQPPQFYRPKFFNLGPKCLHLHFYMVNQSIQFLYYHENRSKVLYDILCSDK